MYLRGRCTSLKAILYIGHGTRTKNDMEEVRIFLQRVMVFSDIPIQEFCFLKLTEPLIEEGFLRCVERGATEITIVPLFLLAAGHIKEDIPQTLNSLHKRFPKIMVEVRDPLGMQDKILDAIVDLVRKTVFDLTQQDSILIVGVGGSDPSILSVFEEIKKGIESRFEIDHVSVCYLAAAKPGLQEGLEEISKKSSGRVIVVPYLLFYGMLFNLVKQNVRKMKKQGQQFFCTDPLSLHPVLIETVVESARGKEIYRATAHH